MKTIATYINLLAAILLAFAPAAASGQVLMHRRKAFRSSTPAATYLINQNFEGTGYDNSETWTTSTGFPDADYTTTVLLGSQSLALDLTSASCRVRTDFTNQDETWIYFLFQIGGSAPAGDRVIFTAAANGSSTESYSVILTSARKLKPTSGGTATTTALTIGTKYHVWIHLKKATGAGNDAVVDVGFSTDGTKPADPSNEFQKVTNGSTSTQIGRIYLGCNQSNAATPYIYDKVLLDDVTIGSNP
jgi:hypothetical protein